MKYLLSILLALGSYAQANPPDSSATSVAALDARWVAIGKHVATQREALDTAVRAKKISPLKANKLLGKLDSVRDDMRNARLAGSLAKSSDILDVATVKLTAAETELRRFR